MVNTNKIWNVIYYPPKGENNSPEDILYSYYPVDQNKITRSLTTISNLEMYHWPPKWVKLIKNIDLYQLTAGDFRAYFGISGKNIVVCHICRKRSQEAKDIDLNRANINFNKYVKE